MVRQGQEIAVLLRKKGWKVSASAVGRILAEAKRRGVLREPPRPGVARRKPRPIRPYVGPLNRTLREWEAYYNAERPHQSLGWLSPMEYLAEQRLGAAS